MIAFPGNSADAYAGKAPASRDDTALGIDPAQPIFVGEKRLFARTCCRKHHGDSRQTAPSSDSGLAVLNMPGAVTASAANPKSTEREMGDLHFGGIRVECQKSGQPQNQNRQKSWQSSVHSTPVAADRSCLATSSAVAES